MSEVEAIEESVVWTPYYIRVTAEATDVCQPPNFTNYQPYDLFVLHTHLTPWLARTYREHLGLSFPTQERNGGRYVTVVPLRAGEPRPLSPEERQLLQAEVDRIIAESRNACLLITDESFSLPTGGGVSLPGGASLPANDGALTIPSWWITRFLPFVDVDEALHPRVQIVGTYGLVVELGEDIDYEATYRALFAQVRTRLARGYIGGYIAWPEWFDGEEYLPWGITRPEDALLARPMWEDRRITAYYGGPVGFVDNLPARRSLRFLTENNAVVRHYIAINLALQGKSATFVDETLEVRITTYEEAAMVASILEDALVSAKGRVIPVELLHVDWADSYNRAALALGFTFCTYRVADDEGIHTIASFGIPRARRDEDQATIVALLEEERARTSL